MFEIDLNCDLGEAAGNDELIIPFISSASIACGYHAGDEGTMKDTVELCLQHNVAVGAHPSFPDKENFGRVEMDISYAAVYGIITEQLTALSKIINSKGGKLHHVKPHGALYNLSAKDPALASVIARAVRDFDDSLILYGLAGSHSIEEAVNAGLKTYGEVFADRTYQDDGSLTPRSESNALIEKTETSVSQVLQVVKEKMVLSVSGNPIAVTAQTICVHGDGAHAVALAKAIHEALRQHHIEIKA